MLLIVKAGPRKGVALERMISAAFCKGFDNEFDEFGFPVVIEILASAAGRLAAHASIAAGLLINLEGKAENLI